MTERTRLIVRSLGTVVALTGLVISFFGYQSSAFLAGKGNMIGSLIVLAGIVLSLYARPKVTR